MEYIDEFFMLKDGGMTWGDMQNMPAFDFEAFKFCRLAYGLGNELRNAQKGNAGSAYNKGAHLRRLGVDE